MLSQAWFPQNKNELEKQLKSFIKPNPKNIHGLIVPHAGYEYSGAVAGKAYSLIDKKIKRAIILGPSHQIGFYGIAKIPKIKTPLGETEIIKSDIRELHGLNYEHSVFNQVPFLQFIAPEIKILPIVVGNLLEKDAEKIAEQLAKELDDETILVISGDLSHFHSYNEAVKIDKNTIKIIEDLDFKKINELDSCGLYPLLILFHLCKLKNWKPKLIEYKNSGDVIGDKSGVVGYGSFWF